MILQKIWFSLVLVINIWRQNKTFLLNNITQENGTDALITILLLSTDVSADVSRDVLNKSGRMCKTASQIRAKNNNWN